MERIVNYSSEDEYEDSPKRNAAERCPVLDIDPNKRNKGDCSSRHPKEESIRDRSQGTSFHRDHKDASLNVFRKNSHKEENRSSRPSSSRGDQHHHRDDRRSERTHEKKRDSKDDRRRKDSHRERDRDYEHRELDRDRRDRSEKHRRERYAKDNSHREKGRQKKRSSDSPTPINKEHNTSSSNSSRNNRNRSSTSRSPSKEQRIVPSIPPAGGGGSGARQQKEEPIASTSLSQNKSAINLHAVLSPPLSDEAPKTSIVINKTDGTPIALPTYYNPNIINPTKYAEQVQKRKLIWGAKKAEDTSAKWGHATFSEDQDGKVASKFMRLMGIKSAPKPSDSQVDAPAPEKKGPDVKSRQAMFSNMEQQYEVARQVTHTMRGVGLGFGSQSRQY